MLILKMGAGGLLAGSGWHYAMVTLDSSCAHPGGLCGPDARSCSAPSAKMITKEPEATGLIITDSFNGLLGRLAEVDHFNVWYEWSKARKAAKKQKREPTISMSQVFTLTGLQREDLELFAVAIPLIEIVETGDDPLLSFKDVFCLVKIFERFVG